MGEKRYYWIKLKTDFFDIPTIDWLQDQKNGCEYIVLYQKLCLLSANNGGELIRNIGKMIVPYDVKTISEVTRFKFDTVLVAMELYKKIGLIVEREDGIFIIPGIGEMIGSETKWAEKKRLQRGQEKDNVSKLSSKSNKNKGHNLDNVPPNVPDNVQNNVPYCDGTSEPTLSDKRLEYRDKSIESRDKTLENKVKGDDDDNARVRDGEHNLSAVISLFSDNIHPVSGEIEANKLADLTEHYGRKWMEEAINEAVMYHGTTLNYIIRILRGWEQYGFKVRPMNIRPQKGAQESGGNSAVDIAQRAQAILDGGELP